MAQVGARARKRLPSIILALAIMADPSWAQVDAHAKRRFDIPAQPLADALEAFSSVSGIELFYDSGLVRARQSAEVSGLLTPDDALRVMLAASPLSARSIASDAMTIVAQGETAAAIEPMPEQSAHHHYFALIQSGLAKSFCSNEMLRRADYRAIVRFRIDRRGGLREMRLVGTTGDGVRDKAIAGALERIQLRMPPPVDLPQPIVIVVLPRSQGRSFDCWSAQ